METYFIENDQDISLIYNNLQQEDVFLSAELVNSDIHPCVADISVLFIKGMKSKNTFVVPIDHIDAESSVSLDKVIEVVNNVVKRKFVYDKKKFFQITSLEDTLDVKILGHFNNDIIDEDNITTPAHQYFKMHHPKCVVLNKIIPINKHLERFDRIYGEVERILETEEADIKFDSFTKLNKDILDTLCSIEKNGLYVDSEQFASNFGEENRKHIHNNLVYSQYNVFTSTGRPSNRFGGINYAALNKDDDTRLCFTSRHGEHGKLVDADFTAFHPHLIANLINYKLDPDMNIYQYLGQYYFKTVKLDKVDMAKSKSTTFRQLYGGVEPQYRKIPYFAKWNEYVKQRFSFFMENGYVETPIYNRKITVFNTGDDINANKLSAYILQAYETEVALHTASRVLDYISGKKTKLILYTYDSLLFDFHKDDGLECLKGISEIMENNGKYPIKIKMGDNYKKMVTFNI